MELFQMPFFIYEILICLFLSVFFFRKITWEDRLLPVFLFVLLCVEYACAVRYQEEEDTDFIYNFWFPIEYVFYSIFISNYIVRRQKKMFSRVISGIYIVFTITYYIIIRDVIHFSSLCYLCGFMILLITMLFKFYEILNQEIIHNPLRNEVFWFMMGLLIVNLGGFFRFGAANYIYKNNKELHNALQQLNVYLTEVQYFFFILFFFFRWKKQN